MRKKYILLDLDGTLTDSSKGITKSVQYALEKMGITENDMAVLKRYIGPPLNESFTRFHGLSDEDSLKAVAYYRERYADTGLYENKLFDGIKEFLAGLKKEGYIVALATCKPEIYVPTILKHFDIEQYFDVAVGSELEGGKRRHKDDVIEEVISQIIKLKDIPATDIYDVKADAIMIGDRKDDVLGAKDAGIESIGLRYGFAEADELENAGADYILENVEDILPFLNQM
jgi:phosphoglycolate phosphatase